MRQHPKHYGWWLDHAGVYSNDIGCIRMLSGLFRLTVFTGRMSRIVQQATESKETFIRKRVFCELLYYNATDTKNSLFPSSVVLQLKKLQIVYIYIIAVLLHKCAIKSKI